MLRKDEIKHFVAVFAITIVVLALFALFYHKPTYGWDKGIALGIGCLVAAAKELVWDKWMSRGTPGFYDFLAGVYGAFAAMFLWVIGEMIVFYFLFGR